MGGQLATALYLLNWLPHTYIYLAPIHTGSHSNYFRSYGAGVGGGVAREGHGGLAGREPALQPTYQPTDLLPPPTHTGCFREYVLALAPPPPPLQGAPESVLDRCTYMLTNSGEGVLPLTDAVRSQILERLQFYGARQALRCLALAFKQLSPAVREVGRGGAGGEGGGGMCH